MKLKTASLTSEAKTIPLTIFKVPTAGTGFRGISGINSLNYNTSIFSLIFKKLSELVESPRMKITPLCFPMLGRHPDTSEVFDSDCWLWVFQSFIHNSLRDTVVYIGLKPLLSTAKAFQGAFSTPRPFSLKASANSPVVMFSILNSTPTKELSGGGNGYKSLPHIAANDCGYIFKFWGVDCSRKCNIEKDAPLAFDKGSSSYIPAISEIFSLGSTKNIGDFNSSLNSRDAYRLGFGYKPEISTPNSTLKKDAGRLESSQMPLTIGLHRGISASDLPNSRASHLGSKGKSRANILVSKPMQSQTLRKIVILKGYLANIITGLGKAINRFPQCLGRVNQLQGYCASNFIFHQELVYHIFSGKSNLIKEVGQFLCQLKQAVPLP